MFESVQVHVIFVPSFEKLQKKFESALIVSILMFRRLTDFVPLAELKKTIIDLFDLIDGIVTLCPATLPLDASV